MKQNNMLAMILAGGRGTRLHELTKKMAKPAVSYGGKYRIIDFPLSNCANSGIDVVGVLTQYESIQLNSYVAVGRRWGLDASTVMLQSDAAGVWMRRTVVCMYFRRERKQMPTLTYTEELQMQFHRISTLLIHSHRNIF